MSSVHTQVVGIDFAAAIDRTAIVDLVWEPQRIVVDDVRVGADDEAVLDALERGEAAGVDVPFGWPDAFVETIVAHRAHELAAPESSGRDWRRPLTYRATDIDVADWLGVYPLSVSADRIGHAALRWAAIAARSAEAGRPIERDGASGVFEVYPAAALRSWDLGPATYKGTSRTEERDALLTQIERALRAVEWAGMRDRLVAEEDAFDAFVCALVARSAAVGHTLRAHDQERARNEGWIHVPIRVLSGIRPEER